jgi:hypothetical protein
MPSFRARLRQLVLPAVVLAACDRSAGRGDSTASDSAAAGRTAATTAPGGPGGGGNKPDFDKVIGNAKPRSCKHVGSDVDACTGFVDAKIDDWDKPANHAEIIKRLREVAPLFQGTSAAVPRPAEDSTKTVELEIRHAMSAERLWVSDLARAYVVARITNKSMNSGLLDAFYKTGRPDGTRRERDFYVVAFDYRPDKQNYERGSYHVAKYKVFAIDTQLVSTGKGQTTMNFVLNTTKEGSFRVCGEHHPPAARVEGAKFLPCEYTRTFAELVERNPQVWRALENGSIYEALTPQRLAAASPSGAPVVGGADFRTTVERSLDTFLKSRGTSLRQEDVDAAVKILIAAMSSPGWMPCGVGCCTADS